MSVVLDTVTYPRITGTRREIEEYLDLHYTEIPNAFLTFAYQLTKIEKEPDFLLLARQKYAGQNVFLAIRLAPNA